ncbi:MAG TPA: FAD-dependent oxidoreductase [Candidatus Polarisedimenticolia bacterium]|nr:FAD-dependent oxidoreductase [Candidatus Polarisedimenticolia bacterium]
MKPSSVIVVGAGVMGLWAALRLRQAGHDVLLLDAWGVAHSRATSGDENRVIRCGYGGSGLYARWAKRSLDLWEEAQDRWGEQILHRTGVLWLVAGEEEYALRCLEDLKGLRMRHLRLGPKELARAYPQIRPQGIRWAFLEPEAGLLLARRSCRLLARELQEAGGRIEIAEITSPQQDQRTSRASGITTRAGKVHLAGSYVFACGPWLPTLFPDLLARRIRVPRKEVFYFGTPADDDRFGHERMPVWMELGAGCYGVPAVAGKGFKVHPDLPSRSVDPTTLERRPSARHLAAARACLARRFPALRDAPVLESRVCQYEVTPDDHMVFDRHPRLENVWILGGGSGHCFKHGPVIGEMAAEVVSAGRRESIPPELRLDHRPQGRNF